MRKLDRLFDLVQALRDGRLHTGRALAERTGVSLRTLYRDIDGLVAAGVPISGERGVGFMMTEPVFLPPLTLLPDEIEALELGIALVRAGFGGDLAASAGRLGEKVRAALPARALMDPDRTAVRVHAATGPAAGRDMLPAIRRAILSRRMLRFDYTTLAGATGPRHVRPLEIEVWQGAFTLTAWCEDRQDFRVFRIDRITGLTETDDVFRPEPGRRLRDYLARLQDKPPKDQPGPASALSS
jgi:predicted DNA-binding transcriptional regulator YafY